jgi:hypothetical protein
MIMTIRQWQYTLKQILRSVDSTMPASKSAQPGFVPANRFAAHWGCSGRFLHPPESGFTWDYQ